MFCSNCGKKIPDNAKFCMFCGTPVVFADIPTVENDASIKAVEKQLQGGDIKTGFVINKKTLGFAVLAVVIIAIVVLVIGNGTVFNKSKPSTNGSEKVDLQTNTLPSEKEGNVEAIPSPTPAPTSAPTTAPTPEPTPAPTEEPIAYTKNLEKFLGPWSGISISNLVQNGTVYTKLFSIDFSMEGALGGAHWTFTGKYNEETGEVDCYDGTVEKRSKFEYGTEYDCTGTLRLLDDGKLEFWDDSTRSTYTFYPLS